MRSKPAGGKRKLGVQQVLLVLLVVLLVAQRKRQRAREFNSSSKLLLVNSSERPASWPSGVGKGGVPRWYMESADAGDVRSAPNPS